jgi:hypothetical protein
MKKESKQALENDEENKQAQENEEEITQALENEEEDVTKNTSTFVSILPLAACKLALFSLSFSPCTPSTLAAFSFHAFIFFDFETEHALKHIQRSCSTLNMFS